MTRTILLLAFILSIITISCDIDNNEKQFTLLTINQTGIDFNNQLNEDNSFVNASMDLSILRLCDFSSNIYSPILILLISLIFKSLI